MKKCEEEANAGNSNTLNVQVNLKREISSVCQFSYLQGSNEIVDGRLQVCARVSFVIFKEDHGSVSWLYKMINTMKKTTVLFFFFNN